MSRAKVIYLFEYDVTVTVYLELYFPSINLEVDQASIIRASEVSDFYFGDIFG